MSLHKWKIGLALLAACGSPAVAADQFNLICEGVSQDIAPLRLLDESEAFTVEFRFDLLQRKYCFGTCEGLIDIYAVDATTIRLKKSVTMDPIYGTTGSWISRVTGEYRAFNYPKSERDISTNTRATCKSAPFSGFPKRETKF